MSRDSMKLVLGHNQFIGISHISEEKARAVGERFSDVGNVFEIVRYAHQVGFRDMIIETHPRMLEFMKYFSRHADFDMNFHLQLPYVQGYVKKMNEGGIRSVVLSLLRNAGPHTSIRFLSSSLRGLAKSDYMSIALAALRFETAPFKNYDIKTIMLHNVFTDLLLSLGASEILADFVDTSKDDLGFDPGFITLNLPLFDSRIRAAGIRPSFVMTPVNINGYDMNPSKSAVEDVLRGCSYPVIAMNVLGGGAFAVDDAGQYLRGFENVKYAAVGASSKEHLLEISRAFL